MTAAAERRLIHGTLRTEEGSQGAPSDDGIPLEHAQPTDQQRLAALLQGAALLAHLDSVHAFLPDAWRGARWSESRGLVGLRAKPGQELEMPQVLLLNLASKLFRCEGPPAGRGEARRAARRLDKRWRQTLVPIPAGRMLEDIFEMAPFLWQPGFAEARTALWGEHVRSGERRGWLVGPGAFRRRALGDGHREDILARLRSDEARGLWYGDGSPFGWNAPDGARAGVGVARELYDLGRYRQALEVLKRRSSVDARLVRVSCQYFLGELGAASNTIRRLAEAPLKTHQTFELTEIASRTLAARGRRDEIRDWIARCLAVGKGATKPRALVTAAAASLDRGDYGASEKYLGLAREAALEDPELAWRWHTTRGQLAMAVRDGLRLVEHLTEALRWRRRLAPIQAGRLWNDLAVGRAFIDDLPGAERACRHAQRLLRQAEGPSPVTLTLTNLAEVRLRRGKPRGVAERLQWSTAENRQAGNVRGLIQDLELWVRLELSQGRPVAALGRCSEALQQFDFEDLGDRRPVFLAFAARAHGWLGRAERALECLEDGGAEGLAELELEERPVVWALAGRLDRAVREAAGTPWAPLWTALAEGGDTVDPDGAWWDPLQALEPFRAARLLFDCELVSPGIMPPHRIRQAIATLRRCDAEGLAERLESRSLAPWRALERYCESRPTVERAAELLESAGYRDVCLSWERADGRHILLDGQGGRESLAAPWQGGELVLHSPTVDAVLRALFAVVRRDLHGPAESTERETPRPSRDGIVGVSPTLVHALDRLDRLARGQLPILILGESGTGKELVARRVHAKGPRASGPFVPVNCAALSETLIQSDLFGHVRGAFTGADKDRQGVFESARGGTVFLDEIGDLPSAAQGKLLRVLQEHEIRRVGESFARKVDVRIVAATHRELADMVEEGTFRQDLFFRLKVATIRLPPLREREGDILALAEHFMVQHRAHFPHVSLSAEARRRLTGYAWPGNIRELKNVLEVAVALASPGEIEPEHLELSAPADEARNAPVGDYHRQIESFRRDLVERALRAADGNRAEAARRLGLTRQALSYLVRQLGLS